MTYEQIEKEFDEKFFRETYWENPTPDAIKSFLKQSFIKFLEGECERLEKDRYKDVGEVAWTALGDEMIGYNQALLDTISHFTNLIEEIKKS